MSWRPCRAQKRSFSWCPSFVSLEGWPRSREPRRSCGTRLDFPRGCSARSRPSQSMPSTFRSPCPDCDKCGAPSTDRGRVSDSVLGRGPTMGGAVAGTTARGVTPDGPAPPPPLCVRLGMGHCSSSAKRARASFAWPSVRPCSCIAAATKRAWSRLPTTLYSSTSAPPLIVAQKSTLRDRNDIVPSPAAERSLPSCEATSARCFVGDGCGEGSEGGGAVLGGDGGSFSGGARGGGLAGLGGGATGFGGAASHGATTWRAPSGCAACAAARSRRSGLKGAGLNLMLSFARLGVRYIVRSRSELEGEVTRGKLLVEIRSSWPPTPSTRAPARSSHPAVPPATAPPSRSPR